MLPELVEEGELLRRDGLREAVWSSPQHHLSGNPVLWNLILESNFWNLLLFLDAEDQSMSLLTVAFWLCSKPECIAPAP